MRRPNRAALVQALLERQQASARALEAAGAPAQPKAIEARLILLGERVAEAFHRRVMEALGPIIKRAMEREQGKRADAIDELAPEGSAIDRAMRSLESQAASVTVGVAPAVDAASRDLDSWNAEEIARQISIPVDSVAPDPEALNEFRDSAVGLIKDISAEQHRRIKELVDEAQTTGMRVETLAKRLEDELGIAKRRARLIGRDQVLKANAKLTQDRMQAAGFKRYRWSSGTDARVRPMHRELDGQVFSWDDPPVTNPQGDRNHPGQDYQCRCGAIPVFEADSAEESAAAVERSRALITGRPMPAERPAPAPMAPRPRRAPRQPRQPRPRPARARAPRRVPTPPRSAPTPQPTPPPPEPPKTPQGLSERQREAYQRAAEEMRRERPAGPQWGEGAPPEDGAAPPWQMERDVSEGWLSSERGARPFARQHEPLLALLLAEGNAVIRSARAPGKAAAAAYVNGQPTEMAAVTRAGASGVVRAVRRAARSARSVVIDVSGQSLGSLPTLRDRIAKLPEVVRGEIDFVRLVGGKVDVTWDFRQRTSS